MNPRATASGVAVIRSGLALGALAAALAALSPVADVAVTDVDSGGVRPLLGVIVGIVGLVIAGCAALPTLASHLVGVTLTTAVAVGTSSGVYVVRTWLSGDDLALRGGGVLLVASFCTALVGVGVMLVGVRKVALAAPPAESAATGTPPDRPPTPRRATLSLLLGVAGLLVVLTAPLAVAQGTLALGDIRASRGHLGGRARAVGGVALGLLALSLLAGFGLVQMLGASPGDAG